jgi:hypothetical protein
MFSKQNLGIVVLVVVSATVLLTGCSSDPVHDRWSSRETLPSCGTVVLNQGDSLEQPDTDGVACLNAALGSRHGAELKVTYTTTEGNPITGYYRVTPDGIFEIYTDSTHDNYGDQRWGYEECGARQSLTSLGC